MRSPQVVDWAAGAPAVVDGSCRAILCGTERARQKAAEPIISKLWSSILLTDRDRSREAT